MLAGRLESVPIQLPLKVDGLRERSLVPVPLRSREHHVAKNTVIHDFLRCLNRRRASSLHSNLHDLLALPHGLDHLDSFFYRVRHGLFEVDVLSRLNPVKQHGAVPVVRCGYEHCLYFLVVEDLAIFVS